MENSEIKTHLETIDFYIKESEQFRDDLELTDAKYFPKKVEWLIKSYKECVQRILFECRITPSVSQDTLVLVVNSKLRYGAFSKFARFMRE